MYCLTKFLLRFARSVEALALPALPIRCYITLSFFNRKIDYLFYHLVRSKKRVRQ